MSGRHRKPWYREFFERRARRHKRTELLEDLMDQVTNTVLDCGDVFEGGTASAVDTVERIADILELS